MNPKSTTQFHTRAFVVSMMIGLIIAQTSFSAVKPSNNSNFISGNEEPAKKDKSKVFTSRNNPSIKIFPDVLKKSMHVVARRNNGKSIDFFVFDMEGTLIENYKMKAKDHMKIRGLKKGSYVFRVFCGDEETASGNFEIQ